MMTEDDKSQVQVREVVTHCFFLVGFSKAEKTDRNLFPLAY